MAAWPGTSPAASARLAGAASFAGSQNAAGSTVTGAAMATVAADSVYQLKVSEAAARQAALRQAIRVIYVIWAFFLVLATLRTYFWHG